MIVIDKTELAVEREPLLAPFGFKGGYVNELWQSVVTVEDREGTAGTGFGVQSVLWSDPGVYEKWGNERGNEFMSAITKHALSAVRGISFETPMELLDGMVEAAGAYAAGRWNGDELRRTFVLNALVPVDHAAWVLLGHKRPGAAFSDLVPDSYREALACRHEWLAATPVVSYGMSDEDVSALLDEGYFVLKIKLGANPDGDGDPDKMLAWDIARLAGVHRLAGGRECPYTANGKIAYYLDINGQYPDKELLLRLLDAAGRMGALEHILLVEEPFPEQVEVDVSDLPVRIAFDESVHDERDAVTRIQMGCGAFALKPVAKTMSMSLRIANLAHERGIPCFCADLTASPVMVDWNKNLAARLAPVPGLAMGLIESNGKQNYRNWDAMKRRHPMPGADWSEADGGRFRLSEEFYAYSGGVFG